MLTKDFFYLKMYLATVSSQFIIISSFSELFQLLFSTFNSSAL